MARIASETAPHAKPANQKLRSQHGAATARALQSQRSFEQGAQFMAKVRFGSGVAEIRGSIEGVTYTRNRAGASIRNRIVPINPNSPIQSTARANFSVASESFSDLSVNDVKLWNNYAEAVEYFNIFGEMYHATGRQVFMEVNLNRLLDGTDMLGPGDPPPASAIRPAMPAPAPGGFTQGLESTANLVTLLELQNGTSQDGVHWFVQSTMPLMPSQNHYGQRYRQISNVATPAAVTSLTAAFNAAWGNPPIEDGQIIWLRLRSISLDNYLGSAWARVAVTPNANTP